MSRSVRRNVAYPRGRPKVLQFPAKGEDDSSASPKPILEYHAYYLVGGAPIHFICQRWKAEDAAHSPTPGVPDPYQPGIVLSSRLEGGDGAVIQAVSYEAWRAATLARPEGCTAQPAGTFAQAARR